MRVSIVKAAIAAIVALHSLATAGAGQKSDALRITEEQARGELAVLLAQRDEAAEGQDIERFLSFYAADFSWRLPGGKTLNRRETEEVIRASVGGPTLEHRQRSTIKQIKLRGNEAVLHVENSSFIRQRLLDGAIKEDTSSGAKKETWIKTEQGWKLKRIDNGKAKQQTTVNGQSVDPLKAPSNMEMSMVSVEDQTLLQEGYAIVFVYRMKDGTIVKTPVYCGDAKLAEMTGGSFIRAKLKPGKYTFRSEKGPAIDINLASPRIYFFALKLTPGFPKGRGVLEVDTSAVGPSAYKLPKLMELRPLGKDNIDDTSRVIVERQ